MMFKFLNMLLFGMCKYTVLVQYQGHRSRYRYLVRDGIVYVPVRYEEKYAGKMTRNFLLSLAAFLADGTRPLNPI